MESKQNQKVKITGIYKITSPSNRVYIGQAMDKDYRWHQYEKLKCKGQPKIYRSLLKYGVENHKFEIIEECTQEQLNEKEIFYKQKFIDEFGWKMALFCKLNDGKGGEFSKEIRNKMSKSSLGKKKTKEHSINISKGLTGIKRSKETCEKISKNNKGKKKFPNGRIISKETRDKMSKSAKRKIVSKEHSKNISNSLKGKNTWSKGRRKLNLKTKYYEIKTRHIK